jgi:hypothetical protein
MPKFLFHLYLKSRFFRFLGKKKITVLTPCLDITFPSIMREDTHGGLRTGEGGVSPGGVKQINSSSKTTLDYLKINFGLKVIDTPVFV